jgi:dihydroorotase
MKQLTITKPDDWHLHLRDHSLMTSVVNYSAGSFQRALIMPNLSEPITDVNQALSYRERILASLNNDSSFQPLMTLYLTAETSPEQIKSFKECSEMLAVKMYPAGATTHSDAGIQDIGQGDAVFEMMQKMDIPLSIHGEVVDPNVDIFDREKVYIERVLRPLIGRYPSLRIIMEHLTTKEGVDFIRETPPCIVGTITPHHLLLNRNDLLVGGIKPHLYCLPIVKSEEDRKCLQSAATSGNPKFFLGTDSAPHLQINKETGAGMAGIFSAPVALPLCVEMFDRENCLERLEGFCSFYGADFYGLPRNLQTIRLKQQKMTIPERYPSGDHWIVPLLAGETITWSIDRGEA